MGENKPLTTLVYTILTTLFITQCCKSITLPSSKLPECLCQGWKNRLALTYYSKQMKRSSGERNTGPDWRRFLSLWIVNSKSAAHPVLPRWLSGKEHACQCRRRRRRGFNPWIRKIPWRRKWQPLQHSCLGKPMDREPGGLQSTGSQRVRHD